jgi:hypothetical protein
MLMKPSRPKKNQKNQKNQKNTKIKKLIYVGNQFSIWEHMLICKNHQQ